MIMSTALLALALVVGLGRAWLVMRWSINREVWLAVMRKTLGKGEHARAIKLGTAVGSPIGDAMKAAILRAGALDRDEPAAAAEQAIREAHDHALQPIELLAATRPLSLLALALAGFGGWTAWTSGEPPLVQLGLALGAVAVVVWAEVRALDVLGIGPAGLEQMLPLLLPGAAIVDPYRVGEPATSNVPLIAVYRDGVFVRTFPLEGPIVKIGRQASSHVHLDHSSVSRMHAVLEKDGDAWTVIDLGNGTRVRGESVAKAVVRSGDRIGIGVFELVFTPVEPSQALEPLETEAPGTEALFFGFDDRAPDLFFEATVAALRAENLAVEARVHSRDSAPHAVVSLWGDRPSLERARTLLASDEPYARFQTPREHIVPDAAYGPETRLHAVLSSELSARTPDRRA